MPSDGSWYEDHATTMFVPRAMKTTNVPRARRQDAAAVGWAGGREGLRRPEPLTWSPGTAAAAGRWRPGRAESWWARSRDPPRTAEGTRGSGRPRGRCRLVWGSSPRPSHGAGRRCCCAQCPSSCPVDARHAVRGEAAVDGQDAACDNAKQDQDAFPLAVARKLRVKLLSGLWSASLKKTVKCFTPQRYSGRDWPVTTLAS